MAYGVRVRNTPMAPDWATYFRTAREAARMSQSEAARQLGTDRTTVWRWENRRQKPENAEVVGEVVRVFKLDLDEALAAAGLRPGVGAPAQPTQELDEEIELVRTDHRLTENQKRRIIQMIEERREADRARSIEETKRVIDLFRRSA